MYISSDLFVLMPLSASFVVLKPKEKTMSKTVKTLGCSFHSTTSEQ